MKFLNYLKTGVCSFLLFICLSAYGGTVVLEKQSRALVDGKFYAQINICTEVDTGFTCSKYVSDHVEPITIDSEHPYSGIENILDFMNYQTQGKDKLRNDIPGEDYLYTIELFCPNGANIKQNISFKELNADKKILLLAPVGCN